MNYFRALNSVSVALLIAMVGHREAGAAEQQALPDAVTADAQDQKNEIEEIIVTGTQIRGVAPVGANVIGISEEQIAATGAKTTGDVLANLPQAANFFNASPFGGGGNIGGNARNAIIRVNLRNLPGTGTTTGSQTLILVDGHRVVGTGVGVLAIDPEILPPGALQRVETMTDGVSSLYGSDAIGGVMNFITRRKFNGVEVNGSYGLADDYNQWATSITAGTNWDGGSIFASYSYASHDDIFGRDRDYAKRINWQTGIPTGRNCNASTIVRSGFPSGTTFAGTSPTVAVTAPQVAVACDDIDNVSIYPQTDRNNVFVGFEQALADSVRLDVRGFFQNREDTNIFGGLKTNNGNISVTIPSTNYYRNLLGFSPSETQSAFFNYGSVLGNDFQTGITRTESSQITPTLTWDVSDSWQMRALGSYGESRASYANRQINTTLQSAALAGSTAQTALNPYDIGATQSLGLIFDIGSFVDRGESLNKFTNLRVIADGQLFPLPAGEVHLAIGGEYLKNDYSLRITDQVLRRFNPWASFAQDVRSAFSELSVPIISDQNRMPGVERLTLSLSARYDRYNDFGDTFNPRVGLTFEPVDWVSLRGSWGTSFNAPTPPDSIGAISGPRIRVTGAQVPPGVVVPAPPAGGSNGTIILDQAAVVGLQPQEAETWSAGFTVRPAVVPGLSLDASYYSIALDGQINSPAAGSVADLYASLPQFLDIDVTPEDVAAALATNPTTGPSLATQIAENGTQIVTILDNRTRNLGTVKISGIDFAVTYGHSTSFGSVDASLSGNHQINQDRTIGPTTTDGLQFGQPIFRAAATIGANIGNLRAQGTLNHTGGYDLAPSATIFNQTHVSTFNVFNAYFRYDFKGEGLASGRSISLNINNVFDRDPPALHDSDVNANGFAPNTFTVGRMIQLGFSQKF